RQAAAGLSEFAFVEGADTTVIVGTKGERAGGWSSIGRDSVRHVCNVPAHVERVGNVLHVRPCPPAARAAPRAAGSGRLASAACGPPGRFAPGPALLRGGQAVRLAAAAPPVAARTIAAGLADAGRAGRGAARAARGAIPAL